MYRIVIVTCVRCLIHSDQPGRSLRQVEAFLEEGCLMWARDAWYFSLMFVFLRLCVVGCGDDLFSLSRRVCLCVCVSRLGRLSREGGEHVGWGRGRHGVIVRVFAVVFVRELGRCLLLRGVAGRERKGERLDVFFFIDLLDVHEGGGCRV